MNEPWKWQKGKSGNPGGRPRHKPFLEAMRMELEAAGDDNRKLRQLAAKVISMAEEGDLEAVKLIWDRLEGKAIQQVDVSATIEQIPPQQRMARILELQARLVGEVVNETPVLTIDHKPG